MQIRFQQFGAAPRRGGALLGLAVVGAGLLLLFFGVLLLASVAVVGGIAGVGILGWRAVFGRRGERRALDGRGRDELPLDPRLEVRPDEVPPALERPSNL